MVDGCYFHNCPTCGHQKFAGRTEADARLTLSAVAQGWTVIRIWEHEIYNDLDSVLTRVIDALATLID